MVMCQQAENLDEHLSYHQRVLLVLYLSTISLVHIGDMCYRKLISSGDIVVLAMPG